MKPYNKTLSCIMLLGLVAKAISAQPDSGATNTPAAAPDTGNPPAQAVVQSPAQPPAQPSAPESTNSAPPTITSEYGNEGLRMNFHGAPLNLVLE